MHLETGNTSYRVLRGADLCRKVREGCKVVTGKGSRVGKYGTGKLHSVAGIPDELHNYAFFFNNLSFGIWHRYVFF